MGGGTSHRVALVRCGLYDTGRIIAAMNAAIDLVGFDLDGVRGKRVLLKPNMLGAYPPLKQVTTHPAFVEAAALLFKERGASVAVGDSSNGVYPVDEVWNITGIRKAAELAGAEVAPFESAGSEEREGIRLSKQAFDADIVVNLPKFKTHGLTVMTGAVKNLYGCVPGMVKAGYHRDLAEGTRFAELVVRIAEIVKPQLTLMDAITAMDGNGPSGGNPIDVGLLMAGANPHAVDAVMCQLAGLEPLEVDTIAAAVDIGHFDIDASIEIVGEKIEDVRPHDFKLPDTYVKKKLDSRFAKFALTFIWNHMTVQPVISPARCERCGLCPKSCPVGAISWHGKNRGEAPVIDEEICIECFCCHETCPSKAIDFRRSLLARIARWFGERSARKARKHEK